MKSLKIGELEAKIPLIQGGMGVGISLSGLAGAVALEGGIGVISTAQIGYKEPDWDRNPIEANLRAIKKEVKKAKEISHGGIIATNIMVATKFYDKYVKAAIDAGVDMIISGAGLPLNLPELARKSKVKLAPIVSSKKAAQIIFRRWERNYNTTPDCVIVEGPNAGGHLGFKPEEIEQYNVCRNDEPENTDKYNKTETNNINNINVCQKANSVNLEFDNRAKTKLYSDEIKDIIDFVHTYEEKCEKDIPVVVAGGIYDKSDADCIFELGASGIQVATPFVATKECDAHENYKMAYVNCKKDDIEIIKSPVGMPARAINNKFLKRVKKEGRIAPIKCHQCVSTCNMLETPYCITDALINAVSGNVDEGLIFCGAYAYKINDISTVKDIIKNNF